MDTPALQPDQARVLLRRNLVNLARKVQRGGVLTRRELELVEAHTPPGTSPSDAGENAPPRPSLGRYAQNQTALAGILRVSRKSISRWLREGAPAPRADGRLDVLAWRRWASANAKRLADAADDDRDEECVAKARRENLKLQIAKLTHEVASLKGEYTANAEVASDLAQLRAEVTAVLKEIPDAIAPQVVSLSVPEAAKRIRAAVDQACERLHATLGTTPPGKESLRGRRKSHFARRRSISRTMAI